MSGPQRILIVDDDLVQCRAMSLLLRSAGYEVRTAHAGNEGLSLATQEPVDLILLDVVLPDIDGLEVCRRLKADPRLRDTYVVLLSGVRNRSDDQAAGLEAGADGYIARPIANRELLARVQSLLRLKQAEDTLRLYAEQLEERVAERTRSLERAHERLLVQERLATLGQLAGSIAHELRTPLGAIKNATYLLNLLLETPNADVKEVLSVLESEIRTSERIINNLLDFARLRAPARRTTDLNQCLLRALARLEVPENISVDRVLAESLPAIEADESLLEQVWINLLLNAVQAMPQGGRLTLTTASPHSGLVSVSISDTGVGISPEDRARLFEPLFTTRVKGVGLGLPLVKMLVEAHDGVILVESTVGRGSTFTVELPTGEHRRSTDAPERSHDALGRPDAG